MFLLFKSQFFNMKHIEGINMKKTCIAILCIFNIAASMPWSKDVKTDEEVEIIDGDDIDISKVPNMVALLKRGYRFCGASVINKHFILTAAHCVDDGSDYSIRAGSSNWSSGGVTVKVADIKIHPKYILSRELIDFDIAILKLAQPLDLTEDIAPAKLAEKSYEVKDGETVLLTGWGRTQNENAPEQLQGVELPKINFEECKKMMANLFQVTLTTNFICAKHPDFGHSACPGDSGGPMFHKGIQIGVASYGGPCHNPVAPIAYASVAVHRDWIDSNSKL